MQVLAGIGPLGVPELIIIAFIIILIFGVGRLPEVGSALGKGIREFRKSTKDEDETTTPGEPPASDEASPVATASPDPAFCTNCGASNSREAKFCAGCGQTMGAAVN